MKKYWLVVFVSVVFGSLFGFVVPCLVSSSSTEGVLAGLAIIIYFPILFWWLLKKIFKKESAKNEEK